MRSYARAEDEILKERFPRVYIHVVCIGVSRVAHKGIFLLLFMRTYARAYARAKKLFPRISPRGLPLENKMFKPNRPIRIAIVCFNLERRI